MFLNRKYNVLIHFFTYLFNRKVETANSFRTYPSFTCSMLTTVLERNYYYIHFMAEETKAKRD